MPVIAVVIENEKRNHTWRIAQRVMERNIIRQAQIAPQPPKDLLHRKYQNPGFRVERETRVFRFIQSLH